TGQDRVGIFGNISAFKANAIREANAFAESMGKLAIPISSQTVPKVPGRFASFEYQFRVVDPSDSEVRRTALLPRPDVAVVVTIEDNRSSSDIGTKVKNTKPVDVYVELLKIKDLREKGILTQEEFNAEKKKLLLLNQ
ncbi:MAG: SHOCT domain-containing protein, partial [Pirellulaceae bacterium]|nr:SHOCT domain-containing protein [Pirellulaceae bacterium]